MHTLSILTSRLSVVVAAALLAGAAHAEDMKKDGAMAPAGAEMKKDGMAKDAMKADAMKDGMKKDEMKKDEMKKDEMKK